MPVHVLLAYYFLGKIGEIHTLGVMESKCHTGFFPPFVSLHLRLFDAYHTSDFLTF